MAKVVKTKHGMALEITAGEVLSIRVKADEGRQVEHVAEALADGSLRVYIAPEPAPPVQDPNPISGT